MSGNDRFDFRTVLLFLGCMVALCAYLAFRTHPISDDYCIALQWKSGSSWRDYVLASWQSLQGRWASAVLRYAYLESFGLTSGNYWLVTVVSLCFVVAGFSIASRILYGASRVAVTWATMCVAIFITLASAVDSVLFWFTPLTDYTVGYLLVPLAVYLTVAALERDGPVLWLILPAAAIGWLASTGISELFLLPVWYFLGSCLLFGKNRKYVFLLSLFAMAGTLLSVMAPGNAQRAQIINTDVTFLEIAWGTVFYGLRGLLLPTLALAFLSSLPPVTRVVSVLVTILRTNLDHCLVKAVAGFAVIYPFAIEFALFWNLGAPGPGRAHNLSLFTLILCWPMILAAIRWDYLHWMSTFPRPIKLIVPVVALVLLLSVNPLKMLREIVSGEAARYDLAVTTAEGILRRPETRGNDVVLPTDDLVSYDQNNWVNKCVALYYSAKSVRADLESASR